MGYPYPIVLGSSSVHRKKVLEDLNITFTTMSPDIDEKAIRDTDAAVLTRRIARAKADALLSRIRSDPAFPRSLLITSDQVVVYNGSIREKPEDKEKCRAYLESYRDGPATCVSSICVVDTGSKKFLEGTAIASQHFKNLSDSYIEQLIEQGVVMTCAGGFAVEQHLMNIVMDGHLGETEGEVETIMGLPKQLTLDFLDQIQKI